MERERGRETERDREGERESKPSIYKLKRAVGCMSVRIAVERSATRRFASLLGKCYSVHINASSL